MVEVAKEIRWIIMRANKKRKDRRKNMSNYSLRVTILMINFLFEQLKPMMVGLPRLLVLKSMA
jgi:hypothetical protein